MRLALLLAALVGLWAAPARGNPLDAFGFGARGPALGNAYAAATDDAAAGYYNPAGLARATALQIDLGYQAALPQVRISGVDQGLTATRGLAVGLVLPGRVWRVPIAFGVTLFLPDQHVTRIRVLRFDQPRVQLYDNRTQRLYMAASLAVRVLPGLYLGAGVSFMSRTRGVVNLRGTVTASGDGSVLYTSIDVDLVALRYPHAGLAWDVTRWLSLALVYRHRFQLDVDQAFNIRADIGTPGQPPAVPNATLEERAFSVDLFQPWQLVLGSALRLPRRVLVTYDVTFARFSEAPTPAADYTLKLDIGRLNDLVKLPPAQPYPAAGFHDTLSPALGVELGLTRGALGERLDLDLRGGYRYEPSPVPRQDRESSFADTDKHTFSVGAGATLRRLPAALPQPVSLDLFVAVTALPPRRFEKIDPRSPTGDFTMSGAVPQVGGQVRCRF